MVLPAVAIGIAQAAVPARQTRASMLGVLQQDYVLIARSKGLREWTVIFRHGFRNAMIPVITIHGLQISNIVSGAQRFLTSQSSLAIFAGLAIVLTVLAFNLLGDTLPDLLDPRLRGADCR